MIDGEPSWRDIPEAESATRVLAEAIADELSVDLDDAFILQAAKIQARLWLAGKWFLTSVDDPFLNMNEEPTP